MNDLLCRVSRAKEMVMAYPHYTDEQRVAWLDCLDGLLDVQAEAYKNASEAFERAFSGKS